MLVNTERSFGKWQWNRAYYMSNWRRSWKMGATSTSLSFKKCQKENGSSVKIIALLFNRLFLSSTQVSFQGCGFPEVRNVCWSLHDIGRGSNSGGSTTWLIWGRRKRENGTNWEKEWRKRECEQIRERADRGIGPHVLISFESIFQKLLVDPKF